MSKFSSFRWSQHLYVRIYAAVLLSLAVVALMFFGLFRFYPDFGSGQPPQNFDTVADYASEALPPANASQDDLQAALNHRRWRRYLGMALYAADGKKRLASMGINVPAPDLSQNGNGFQGGRPPFIQVRLPDGRWLISQRIPPQNRAPRVNVWFWLALIALALGVGAYPVARRMTGRLERLQSSVEALGEGQLSTRIAIEGKDEVARLAASFNRSAARIEALVAAQKTLLANASHELRSPLTRIRMAIELMGTQAPAAMREEMVRNITELDQLVDEILLASRLDSAGQAMTLSEHVDLTALLAEECARVDASLDAGRVDLVGDSKLLRRMVRNLLENAKRYGDGSNISVNVRQEAGSLTIDVCDGGRGVPEAERERIFAPFYRLPGARERDGGVGLGLSLVRQIARAHRGEVICLPRDGGGSCFRVTLPVA